MLAARARAVPPKLWPPADTTRASAAFSIQSKAPASHAAMAPATRLDRPALVRGGAWRPATRHQYESVTM
jgi:hypothetical protein